MTTFALIIYPQQEYHEWQFNEAESLDALCRYLDLAFPGWLQVTYETKYKPQGILFNHTNKIACLESTTERKSDDA